MRYYVQKVLKLNGIKELYEFQKEAIEYICSDRNVIVSAPTGAGKSLVAEVALAKAFFDDKAKGVYIAPLRSLVYEKQIDFGKLSKLNIDVVASTGEIWLYKRDVEMSDVLLATVEKFDSIVRHNSNFWDDVGILVVDEIHMIGDGKRGAVLEQILREAMEFGVQIVGLSATIGNLEELAHWLDAEIVYSDERKVKLEYGVYHNGRLEWDDGVVESLDRDWIKALVYPVIERDKSVLVFVNSRREAERVARKIAEGMPEFPISPKYTGFEGVVDRGVGYHHAGLPVQMRKYIEELFRQRKIKVLVATKTLAMGVNLPAYRVIIKGVNKVENGVPMYYDVNEVLQMMGRAGRPKYDTKGEAIIVVMSEHLVNLVKKKYFSKIKQSVSSRMLDYLEDIILKMFVEEEFLFYDEILARLRDSFWYYLMPKEWLLKGRVYSAVHNLFEAGFIREVDAQKRKYAVTEFGRVAGELCIMPRTASILKSRVDKINMFSEFIASIVNTPDMYVVGVKKNEEVTYRDKSKVMEYVPYYVQIAADRFLKEVKTFWIIFDWASGDSKYWISKKHNVYVNDIDEVIEHAKWLAHSFYRIARDVANVDEEKEEMFKEYKGRIEYGATAQMMELMAIDGIDREVAKKLVKMGVKSRAQLWMMRPDELLAMGISEKVVAKIFNINVSKLKEMKKSKSIMEYVGV